MQAVHQKKPCTIEQPGAVGDVGGLLIIHQLVFTEDNSNRLNLQLV